MSEERPDIEWIVDWEVYSYRTLFKHRTRWRWHTNQPRLSRLMSNDPPRTRLSGRCDTIEQAKEEAAKAAKYVADKLNWRGPPPVASGSTGRNN